MLYHDELSLHIATDRLLALVGVKFSDSVWKNDHS